MKQLELFTDEPFVLRLPFSEAVRIFWANYWRHLPSAKTTGAHFRRLNQFFKGHYLDTMSKTDVENLRRKMKDMGYSEPTINKSHMILSRIFRKFEEYKEGRTVDGRDYARISLPPKNPAAQVPKVNERKYARQVFLTIKQKRMLCSYSDEDLCEVIDGLWWTQLRPSDFFRITSKNVNLKQNTITGTQHKTITMSNPTGVPYKVHIPCDRLGIIKTRVGNTKPGTPLFRRKNLQKRWHKVRVWANLPTLQLRDIRSGAASHLLDEGIDPETVRKTLGHTTLRMLPTYDKRPDSKQAEATSILIS